MIHFGHESVGGFMRGRFRDQGGLFSYLSPEARVPAKHPLRQVRELVRAVLKDLSPSFGKLYSSAGRPSIPPEQLLSALLLQVFYGIRSERQLMEQLDYNLLYRWFAGPRDACEHDRSGEPSLSQGGGVGGEALLHGSCHHGEPARACGGRGRHKGRWHGGTARLASHAESQAQGRWSSHHGRRGQGL